MRNPLLKYAPVVFVVLLPVLGFVVWGLDQAKTSHEHVTGGLPEQANRYRVARVVDGDTVHMKDGTKVRLYGIDTPERDQPYGKQATRLLDKLTGPHVFVLEQATDRYGRLVGVLYDDDGGNINLAMVCQGAAWWYQRYAPNDRDLGDCQGTARAQQLGLWAVKDPVPPWDWRRR